MNHTQRLSAALLLMLAGTGLVAHAGGQFKDGLRAIAGKGGTSAKNDAFDTTVTAAKKVTGQPKPTWQAPFPDDGTDFVAFVAPDRALLATIEVEAYLGVPDHKRVILYDTASGRQLWEAPHASLARGSYELVAAEPALVIAGVDEMVAHFQALDATTGKVLWTADVPAFVGYATGPGNRLYIASGRDATTIDARDLATGAVAWSRRAAGSPAGATLLVDDRRVIVASGKLLAFASDGTPVWPLDQAPPVPAGSAIFAAADGIVVWSAQAMTAVDAATGRPRWQKTFDTRGLKVAAAIGGQLVRVRAADLGTPGVSRSDIVESFDAANGDARWTGEAGGTIVSPILADRDLLLFTTDDNLVGLDAATGARRFATAFPAAFQAGSPTKALAVGLPDNLRVTGDRVFIARERDGVVAHSLPGGELLWHRRPVRVGNLSVDGYAAETRYQLMTATMTQNGQKLPAGATRVAGPTFGAAGANGPLAAAQRSFEESMWQQRAQQQRELNSLRAYHFPAGAGGDFGRGGVGVGFALMDMSASIANGLKNSAIRGVVARTMIGVQNAVRIHEGAFQGRYYIRPMEQETGRGFMVVDLESGKRADFLAMPLIGPVSAFGLDYGGAGFDARTARLIAIGSGLEATRFEPTVKWSWRFPKPMLLAFDVAGLPFGDETPKPAVAAAPGAPSNDPLPPAELAEFRRKHPEGLATFAQTGNMELVVAMLDLGISPDAPGISGESPLVSAARAGQKDVIEILLKHGANVNKLSPKNQTAVDVAKDGQTRDLLRKAGGKTAKELGK